MSFPIMALSLPPDLLLHFSSFSQEHVFRYWDILTDAQRVILLSQCARVNLNVLSRFWDQFRSSPGPSSSIQPFENIVVGKEDQWEEKGMEMVGQGKVGCVLMAGGTGTRLGFDKPKGMFDIGLPSHKSLFQIQAEKVKSVKQLAAKRLGKTVEEINIPYYIMTSDTTHDATVNFWKENNNFELGDVFFFVQGMLPAVDLSGKIIMETTHSFAWSANGNGGLYEALEISGAFADMNEKRLEYLHIFSVDNALLRVADPVFHGLCKVLQSDCGNKTCEKMNPTESIGVMCKRFHQEMGKYVTSVVEYSEMTSDLANARTDDGKLQFRAGNIATHCFSLSFLERCIMNRNKLPFHAAKKKICCVSDFPPYETITPEKENGIKMEMFIFDVFPFATNPIAFQTNRELEFSPLKNAVKPGVDCTAETVCRDISRLNRAMLRRAGALVEEDGGLIEIDPLLSYAGENLARFKGQKIWGSVHLSTP